MRVEIALLALLATGCVQKMGVEGHLEADDPVPVAGVPAGTIARGSLTEVPAPKAYTQALLERGRERFDIHCAPCHDFTGSGNGMIVRRGFVAPPSFHSTRIRGESDARIFEVISLGQGAMASYADRVEAADRWAIVAYVRALQLSEHAVAADLTDRDRRELGP